MLLSTQIQYMYYIKPFVTYINQKISLSFTFNSFTEINGNIHCTYISIQYATKKMDTCNSKTTYLTVQKGFSKRYLFYMVYVFPKIIFISLKENLSEYTCTQIFIDDFIKKKKNLSPIQLKRRSGT